MAKQNFMSGGFYGKLGAMVGQRWKNKRTLRVYVIPANPRTPAQQANRKKFGETIPYCQLANMMNYKNAVFESVSNSAWAGRVSTCTKLQKAGKEGLNLIPLYPVTFTPNFKITQAAVTEFSAGKTMTVSVVGAPENEARNYSIGFDMYDEEARPLGLFMTVGSSTAENPGEIMVRKGAPDVLNKNCYLRIVTNDFPETPEKIVASDALKVVMQTKESRKMDISVRSVEVQQSSILVVFNEPWFESDGEFKNVAVNCVINGGKATVTAASIQPQESAGFFSISIPFTADYEQLKPALPADSSVTVGEILVDSPALELTGLNETIPVSNTDLTRPFDTPVKFKDIGNGKVSAYFETAYNETSGQVTRSGSIVSNWEVVRSTMSHGFYVKVEPGQVLFGITPGMEMPPQFVDGSVSFTDDFTVEMNGVTYLLEKNKAIALPSGGDISFPDNGTTGVFTETDDGDPALACYSSAEFITNNAVTNLRGKLSAMVSWSGTNADGNTVSGTAIATVTKVEYNATNGIIFFILNDYIDVGDAEENIRVTLSQSDGWQIGMNGKAGLVHVNNIVFEQ